MASTIDYNPNKKRALLYFLKNAKQNESMTIDPDTGHRSYVFIFTKRGKSAVVQMVWKWHYSWAHNRPIAKMSQEFTESREFLLLKLKAEYTLLRQQLQYYPKQKKWMLK